MWRNSVQAEDTASARTPGGQSLVGPGRESRPGRGAGLEVAGPSSEAWLGTTDFILCAGEAADMGEQWVCCMEPLSPGGGGPGMPLSLSRASRAGGSQGAAWTWLGEPRLCVGRASAAAPSAPRDGVSPVSRRGAGRPWLTPGAFAWLDQRGWGQTCSEHCGSP